MIVPALIPQLMGDTDFDEIIRCVRRLDRNSYIYVRSQSIVITIKLVDSSIKTGSIVQCSSLCVE